MCCVKVVEPLFIIESVEFWEPVRVQPWHGLCHRQRMDCRQLWWRVPPSLVGLRRDELHDDSNVVWPDDAVTVFENHIQLIVVVLEQAVLGDLGAEILKEEELRTEEWVARHERLHHAIHGVSEVVEDILRSQVPEGCTGL